MKKILFIVPPFNNNSNLQYITPPLGIIRVASLLDREAYEIKLMDFPLKIKQKEIPPGPDFYQRCALMILAEGFDIIAFTTLSSNYASVLNIARHVKLLNKELPIVLGGQHATLYASETLSRFDCIDYIIMGDGEVPFKLLADKLSGINKQIDFKDIPGLCFKHADGKVYLSRPYLLEDMQYLPPMNYDFINLTAYRDNSSSFTLLIESGRGCGHNCIICSCCYNINKTRLRSVDSIIEEIVSLKQKNEVDEFYLYDLFLYPESEIVKFCEKIRERNIVIRWFSRARIDALSPKLLETIYSAGCTKLLVNPESLKTNNGKTFRRNRIIDFPRCQEVLAYAGNIGIGTTVYLTLGYPDDSEEFVNQLMSLILEIATYRNVFISLRNVGILPGKNLPPGAEIVPGIFPFEGINFLGPDEILEEDRSLINEYPDLFSSYYYSGESYETNAYLARYFPEVATYFQLTFLLLCNKLQDGPLPIFKEMISSIPVEEERVTGKRGFAESFIRVVKRQFHDRPDCLEIIEYEKILYDLSRGNTVPSSLTKVNDGVFIKKFNFCIEEQIKYIREKRPLKTIHTEKSEYYLFVKKNYGIKINRIGLFLYSFLLSTLAHNRLDDVIRQVAGQVTDLPFATVKEKCEAIYPACIKENLIRALNF
ncbi:MAG: B12-binding domain-containing radical SAM protein [Thermincolia bacterium]